jgi:hypothetical protein
MNELFETKILIGQNKDEFQARVIELEQDGWEVDQTFFNSSIENVGVIDEIRITRLKRSVYRKASHELPESISLGLLKDITKEQWEAALKKYQDKELGKVPVVNSVRLSEDIRSVHHVGVGYVREFSDLAFQEEANFNQKLHSVLSIFDLDRENFLEDFEKWYLNSGTAQSRLFALDVVYSSLATGNGLPWEKY